PVVDAAAPARNIRLSTEKCSRSWRGPCEFGFQLPATVASKWDCSGIAKLHNSLAFTANIRKFTERASSVSSEMRKHFQVVNYASVDYPYLHACHVGRLLRRRYARHLSRPDVFRGTATLREPWLITAVMDPSASA